MAENKQRGFVEIELNGEVKRLRYTLNSLAILEEKLGVKMSKLNDVEMGMREIRSFLWVGLIHEDKGLTEEEVGDWVDVDLMDYISEKIGEAFKAGTRKN
jgi:hypothetical protein